MVAPFILLRAREKPLTKPLGSDTAGPSVTYLQPDIHRHVDKLITKLHCVYVAVHINVLRRVECPLINQSCMFFGADCTNGFPITNIRMIANVQF